MALIENDRSNERIHLSIENLCKRILEIKNIQFAGIIDTMGNLYAGGFKKDSIPKVSDSNRRQMYMRFALESCFRKDFDDSLGKFSSAVIQRENCTIFTINVCNYLLIVFTESPTQNPSFFEKIQKLVHNNKPEDNHCL
jgi:hypothetical protein